MLAEFIDTDEMIISAIPGGDHDDGLEEVDWNDEDDENLDDLMEDENDLNEIRVDDDLYEPDAEDDDHLPDDDLQ